MKYRVSVREVWEQTYTVEASNIEDAIDAACNGNGTEGAFEYVGMLEDYFGDNDISIIEE